MASPADALLHFILKDVHSKQRLAVFCTELFYMPINLYVSEKQADLAVESPKYSNS